MTTLSRDPNAFIRSTPSSGVLGGVGAQTFATRLLCEAAGYSVVLIETVGVGQSETTVSDLTDLFLLLVAPSGGDDLQGIKRGVMEMADLIAINKADGLNVQAAEITRNDYRSALSLVRPKWPDHPTDVLLCSAQENLGIEQTWQALEQLWTDLESDGSLETMRREQAVRSFWQHVSDGTLRAMRRSMHTSQPGSDLDLTELEVEVRNFNRSPASAAERVLRHIGV